MKSKYSRSAEGNFGIEKLRTAIYARKSAEDERQTSLPTQIELCKEFISQYDMLKLTQIYREDNVSGMFTDNRTEYLAMLAAAERQEIDVIVTIRLDRFGRDVANTTSALKLLAMYGCFLIAGDDICDNTPAGEFMRNILISQNQYHARITASRVMQSEIHNAKNGDTAGGIAPYGLRIVDKRFELDDTEAPIVKRIFEMASRRKEL
jgi:DNA invertase Pin-like site-specific DNA recombinase